MCTAVEMAGAQGMAEKQGYLGNLEKRSRTELQDLLNRQEKLLSNKYVAFLHFFQKMHEKSQFLRRKFSRNQV